MRVMIRNLAITFLISAAFGCGAIIIVANSENGYVAGFVFLPLFFLICVATLVLFFVGLICLGLKNKFSASLLLAAVVLPVSFFSSAFAAKHFEIGAYYQEPMISFFDEVNDVIVFKEGTTNQQIEEFLNRTLSLERLDGRGFANLPGIRTMTRIQPRNGREAIAFGFFPNATEEQKEFVYSRVNSSPILHQLLKNGSLKEQK